MMVHCENCKYRIKHKHSPYFFKCGRVSYLKGRLVSGDFGCVAGDEEKKNAAQPGCEYCPMCGRKMEG